jgi:hypothetical protein
MAVRFKASDLKEIVREVVREEIREVVVKTINEVLSERYLRDIVREAVGQKRRGGLEETLMGQTREPPENTPEALDNQDDGIYHVHPVKKESKVPVRQTPRPPSLTKEQIRKQVMGDDFDMLFEGTKPLDEVEQEYAEGVHLPQSPAMEEMANKWKKLVEGSEQKQLQSRPMTSEVDLEAAEARLKRKREALEIPVRGR